MSDGLWSVTKDGISRFMSEAPTVWKGRHAQDYCHEKELVNKMAQPIVWGLSSGVICFIAFRVGNSRLAQYLQTGGRTTPFKKRSTPGNREWKSSMERQQEKKADELRKAASVPIDFALSVLIGLSATGILYEPDKLQKDFSSIPLLPGRSVASEILCKDISNAFDKLSPNVQNGEDVQMFSDFVTNCTFRAQQEATIRQQQNSGKAVLDDDNEPIFIPEPGVSVNSRK
mmetsp:Transcript_18400/g.25941  ORF Transcript_18400/g.25941 Transcript_18400/m.25941 type:complete len:229 (+) Transcript_18400:104-790(+)